MKLKAKLLFVCFLLTIFLITFMHIPVHAAGTGVSTRLNNLRSVYPEGKYWNHVSSSEDDRADNLLNQGTRGERFAGNVTGTQCYTHNGQPPNGQYECNVFDGAMQCDGFARRIFYEVFGERVTNNVKKYDKENIRVGDYVRFGSGSVGHSFIVLERNGDVLTAVECNYGNRCAIKWGTGTKVSIYGKVVNESNIPTYPFLYYISASNYDTVNGTPVDQEPKGYVDSVTGGEGVISVSGWAFDPDNNNYQCDIHVYVGGNSDSGAPCYVVKANKQRTDVNSAYGCGDYHGFSETIQVDKRGSQDIYLYAINNSGKGPNPLIGSKTVTISSSSIDSKMSAFISDSRWKNGTSWGDATESKLSTQTDKGAFAYCADFTQYVYGISDVRHITNYTSISEIRAGDVVKIYDPTYKSDHYFVVLARDGNNLYTAEASYANAVRVKQYGYQISGNSILQIQASKSATMNFACGWHCVVYDFKLNPNGGKFSNGSTATVQAGAPLVLNGSHWNDVSGFVPTRTGYAFAGWYTASSGGTKIYNADGTPCNEGTYWKNGRYVYKGNLTVYAQWTANTYTVTYNANGGSGAPSNQTKTHGTNLTLSSTKPTRSGCTFNGWNTASNGSGTSYAAGATYTANAAVTLYAQWKTNTYTVTYNANGGSGAPSNQTKTHGTNLTLSSTKPTRSGYTFNGWNTASNGSGTSYTAGATYTANAAVTLYAQWKTNTYTVTYNANGGSGAPSNQTKTHGTNLTLSSTKPTRSGYTFSGWNTATNGSGTSYAAGATYTANASVTLYAQWKANSYIVTYNANGGSGGMKNQTKTHGVNLTLTTDTPTRSGYTFSGWNTASNGSGTSYAAGATYTANAAVTLYAQWKANTSASYKKGDVNGDGTIDVKDKKIVLYHIRGINKLSGNGFNAGDVNGDGAVDVKDKKLILYHIRGINKIN